MTTELMNKPTNAMPTTAEWDMLKEQAKMLLTTKFLPSYITTAEQAIAIALKGRELGIPIMQSFSHINIVQGKPCASAELMMALIYKNCPKAKIQFKVTNNEKCVIQAARPGTEPTEFSFTIEDAKKAGLVKVGGPWDKYAQSMLRARCISSVARALFPDAISGVSYTSEELGGPIDDPEILEPEGMQKEIKWS